MHTIGLLGPTFFFEYDIASFFRLYLLFGFGADDYCLYCTIVGSWHLLQLGCVRCSAHRGLYLQIP